MLSFLAALAFAPVLLGLVWMYTSPLRRLDGHTALKVIIRVVLAAGVFGIGVAQLAIIAHSVPVKSRRVYAIPLLVIEAIPTLAILFYRDPGRRRSQSATHTDNDGKKDSR